MVFLDLFLNMMLQTNKMDSKNNNILLFALAGFGLYYFFQKKNTLAPVVPPTTGNGNEILPIAPTPPRQIITPVEPNPVFETPISVLPILTDPISDIISLPGKFVPIEPTPIFDYPLPTPPRQIITPVEPTPVFETPISVLPILTDPISDIISLPGKFVPIEPTPIFDYTLPTPPRQIITPVEPVFEEPIYMEPAPIYREPSPIFDFPIYSEPIYQPEPIYNEPAPIYREPSPIFDFPIYNEPIYQPEPIYNEPIYQPIDIPNAPVIDNFYRDFDYDPGTYYSGSSGSGGAGGGSTSYYIGESVGSGGGIWGFLQNQVWLGNLDSFQAQSYESFDTIKADTSEFA